MRIAKVNDAAASTWRSSQASRQGCRLGGRATTASHEARATLEEGHGSAVALAGDASAALDDAASRLSDEGQETLAQATSAVADQLATLAQSLEQRSLNELVDDARRVARRNPGLFMVGGVVVGLVLSRFFKASPNRNGSVTDDAHRSGATTSTSGSGTTPSIPATVPGRASGAGQHARLTEQRP